MPSYYAVLVDKVDGHVLLPPTGPIASYDAAVGVHARTVALRPARINREESFERRVLVDLATVEPPASRDEWEHTMMTDPVLRAVYERGRTDGVRETRGSWLHGVIGE